MRRWAAFVSLLVVQTVTLQNEPSPDPDATDHLVFDTVHSLLQHWPNTRMRHGHQIVPGFIPKGTLLYHGTDKRELPPGPEWAAMDPEHSYYFCRTHMTLAQQGCVHITLATTRPLNIVYFDGSSAAKLPYGTLDTQDLLIWGESSPTRIWEDEQRIEDLCRWARRVGLDGLVRMEMAFEVMLCDFTSAVRVLSFANIIAPGGIPPNISTLSLFETVHAGSWHDRFPGETRIQLDLSRLISFYDTNLVPSLVAIRASQERWDHRVRNISTKDLLAVKSRLEASLVIVDRFAGRLELTRHILNSPASNPNEMLDLANKTQTQLRTMLTPFLVLSATPTADKTDLGWTIPIYKLCATTYTHFSKVELESMTDSEKLILKAVRGTTREICRVLTKMWAAGVYAGIDRSLNTRESLDMDEVTRVWSKWEEDLDQLMAWLDWSVWIKCNPGCGPEEMCYLPTWPINFPCSPTHRECDNGDPPQMPDPATSPSQGPHPDNVKWQVRMAMASFKNKMQNTVQPELGEWIRPQPKCIERVDPYGF